MVFDVHVEIRGLDGIADPEGRTIERSAAGSRLWRHRRRARRFTRTGSGRRPRAGIPSSVTLPPAGRPAGFIGRGGDRDRTRRQGLLTSSTKPHSVAHHHATTATKAPRLTTAYVLKAAETQLADTSNDVLEVQADLGGGASSTIWMNSATGQYQNLSVTDSRS
jgi:hypothetical protein